jgi:hypothetical protein
VTNSEESSAQAEDCTDVRCRCVTTSFKFAMHARTFIAMKNAQISLDANSRRFTDCMSRLWRSYIRASRKRNFFARQQVNAESSSKRAAGALAMRSCFSAGLCRR